MRRAGRPLAARGGFDFSRIQGRDAAALGKLPSLADLYAHRNVAFVGPGGIGKTHLAQAYGRECCMRGLKTYYIKATELRDRFQKAVQRGNTSRVVSSLVKPSCLIVDEVGRCGSVEKVGVAPDPKRVGPSSQNLEYG